jgi:2-desacetyl-2-hydroxyethyl bacteriochlorophyllide A dehydrogenase
MIMQGLVYEGPRTMRLREVPRPDLAEAEVLVRVRATGICGSDLHGYTGKSGRRLPPMIMGHEFAGVIEEARKGSGTFRAGERVVVQPTIFCGECEYCRRGHTNLCERKRLFGVMDVNGSMATFLNVPERLLYRLPDSVGFEHGAMIEPLAVASSAASKVDVEGKDVLIVGAGTIGLLLLQVVALAKPRRCIVVDVNKARLELAGKLGATTCLDSSDGTALASIDRITGGKGVEIAFEAVGISPTVQTALAPLGKEGVCVWIGNSERMVSLNMQDVVTKAQRIVGTYAYTHAEFGKSLDMVAAGRIALDPLISRVVPLAEGPEMFRLQTESPGSLIKVILTDGD